MMDAAEDTAAGRSPATPPRLLAIIGSGETSPTMVEIHKTLAATARGSGLPAVVLDTPYAFQENAAEVSAKARSYFARSVGVTVTVAAAADEVAAVRTAGWLFCGPGSPTYALARWRESGTAAALRERVVAGQGVTVFASAAAATAGAATVPVYEIYKAGAEPRWIDGLDLFGALGLAVAVIPHFNNAEGRTHDTRYCYLGERRLTAMEQELAADAVLGVDEHTALILDLRTEVVTVLGRGVVTIRRQGDATVLPAGSTTTLAALRGLVAGRAALRARDAETGVGAAAPAVRPEPAPRGTGGGGTAGDQGAPPPLPLPELTVDCERRFEQAKARGDGPAMVAAVLDLEEAVHAWAADTEEDQGTEQARTVLRALITRLGMLVRDGLRDPAEALRPAAEPLLALRTALRQQRRYGDADTIRDALVAAGLVVEDAPDGCRWSVAGD